MLPPLIYFFAIVFLSLAMVCAIIAAIDVMLYPQKKRIMNLVWPVTMIYLGPPGLAFYRLYGRNKPPRLRWLRRQKIPFWAQALMVAIHSGAGCALGNILGEVIVESGDMRLFGSRLAAAFVAMFLSAAVFGLFFQFFAAPPKRLRDAGAALVRAAKANMLSWLAYQSGMFLWLAVTRRLYPDIDTSSWDYWYMVQVAMAVGLAAAYPVNRRLLRGGIKQAM